MAVAGIKITADFPELKALGDGIRRLGDKKFTAQALKDALEKAIFPAYMRLREVSPVGPTGNLKRAATYVAKAYPKDGTAVGLIGYKRSGTADAESAQGGSIKVGPDRAFHQWWLEFGTASRPVPGKRPKIAQPVQRKYQRRSPTTPFTRTRRRNGQVITEVVQGSGVLHKVQEQTPTYIASSYNKLGAFTFEKISGKRVQTNPPYPNAFFKKSKTPIVIAPTPAGGVAGRPPVRAAFDETQGRVAFILTQELGISLQRAIDALVLRDQGTISGV
jgi:hypothetical protein